MVTRRSTRCCIPACPTIRGTPSRRGRSSGAGSLDGSARKKDRHDGETKAEREERKRLKRERRAARQRKKEAAEEAARELEDAIANGDSTNQLEDRMHRK